MPKRMSRPRSRKYRNLPDNLTFDAANGLYRYRNPVTKKQHYLSRDKAACIRAAKTLNAKLQAPGNDLVDLVLDTGNTWAATVMRYEADVFPDLELSDKTRSQYGAYLRKLRGCRLSGMAMTDITVRHVVEALESLTDGRRMRNVYRNQMIQVFRYAVELGWCDNNPAEVTRIVSEKRQRLRLTLAGYDAIYAHAEPWVRAAMDLGLQTLQRREDLVSLRYADIEDGRLYVRQKKTGRKLRIAVSDELRAVIDASRDKHVCPFIIHHRPRRIPSKPSKRREHPMQVLPDKLTAAFRKARDASGYYAGEPAPPSFHEIRSLGADCYRSNGWSEPRIQQLLGHDELSMTQAYLAGHEPPWNDVDSGFRR